MAVNIFGAIMLRKASIVEPDGLAQIIGNVHDPPAFMLGVALVSLMGIIVSIAGMVYLVDRQYKTRRA